MSMKAKEAFAKIYVTAAGICAVVVAEKRRSNVASLRVRSAVDFSTAQIARRAAAGRIDRMVWCSDSQDAELLVRATTEEIIARQISGKGRRVCLPAEQLFAIVGEVAAREKIGITPHDRIVTRAMAVVDRVNAAYAPGSPQLKALNKAYRKHRLAEEALGRQALNYSEWLAAHKTAALKSLASGAQTRPTQRSTG